MIWTAWTNGSAGFGFTVDPDDFPTNWSTVTIELPTKTGIVRAEASIVKSSFAQNCPHVINKEIGRWLHEHGYAPWTKGKPPKFRVEASGDGRFRVQSTVTGD